MFYFNTILCSDNWIFSFSLTIIYLVYYFTVLRWKFEIWLVLILWAVFGHHIGYGSWVAHPHDIFLPNDSFYVLITENSCFLWIFHLLGLFTAIWHDGLMSSDLFGFLVLTDQFLTRINKNDTHFLQKIHCFTLIHSYETINIFITFDKKD